MRAELRFIVGSAYAMRPRGCGLTTSRAPSVISKSCSVFGHARPTTQDWARIHNNLGIAYWGRIRGERADNQEEAIAHFEAALTVFTRDGEARGVQAQLQNNLGIAYWNRISRRAGDQPERAIALFGGRPDGLHA